jgi:hypothetical protein
MTVSTASHHRGAKRRCHLLAQIVGRQCRGVDQDGGASPQRAKQVELPRDAVGRVVVGCERVAAAGFGIAPLKRLRLAIEVQEIRLQTPASRQDARIRRRVPRPRNPCFGHRCRGPADVQVAAPPAGGEEAEGQVVDGLEPEILQRVDRGGAAGTGRPGDEDHARDGSPAELEGFGLGGHSGRAFRAHPSVHPEWV